MPYLLRFSSFSPFLSVFFSAVFLFCGCLRPHADGFPRYSFPSRENYTKYSSDFTIKYIPLDYFTTMSKKRRRAATCRDRQNLSRNNRCFCGGDD
jgi:hypothetical protein